MPQITHISFEYQRSFQPEQYGSERILVSGSASIEEGEDAFQIVDAMIANGKALVYRRLGLKVPPVEGVILNDLASSAQPTPAQAAPAQAAPAQAAPASDGLPEPTPAEEPKGKGGRPKGSSGTPRKSRAEKQAEAEKEQRSQEDALPGDDLPGNGPDLSAPDVTNAQIAEQAKKDIRQDGASDDDMMALIHAEAAKSKPAAAEPAEADIDNAELQTACGRLVKAGKSQDILDYLAKVGVTRTAELSQPQRREMLRLLED